LIDLKEKIRQALSLPEFDVSTAHQMMTPRSRGSRPQEMPGQPRQGAVLVIIYTKDGEEYLVLTRRRDDLNDHAGQISFPGGQREEGETMPVAALREANEEVGVQVSALELLGKLTCIYIPPTDFEVHPFVAWHEGRPIFIPQEREVAEILEVPLSLLIEPEIQHEDVWDIQGTIVEVPYYQVDSYKVWGATAIIMSELLERLRAVS